jgi:adenylate cyclase
VNVAGRVEGATVGGQIFVTASTHAAIAALAEVAPPIALEMKGLSEPLLLYELRGIGGRFAQRLEGESEEGVDVPVELPLVGAVVEGKVVGPDAIRGVVVRLGRRRFDARLSTSLAPLTNVRLTLTYPALGRDSGDLYGKVVSGAPEPLTRVWLTSIEAADEGVFAAFLADPAATGR